MRWSRSWASCFAMCVLLSPQWSFAGSSGQESLRLQQRLPEEYGMLVAEQEDPPAQALSPSTQAPVPEAVPPSIAVVPLVYKPPQRGAPGNRVAAAVRGERAQTPLLYALVPDDHVGLTTQEQPVLYWYLSEPTQERIELTVVNGQDLPIFESGLASPPRGGIQQIRLADYGVRLAVGSQYKWFVSIVPKPDSPSHNVVVGGGIQRVDLSEEVQGQLTKASKENLPAVYATNGFWYDTLAALAALIDAMPDESGFRAQRTALLEQVGLQEVAAHER